MADVVTETYAHLFGGEPNLSMTERGISVALGLGLAAAAAKPRPNPVLNVVALLGGAYLALRGATGRCPVKAALASPDHDRAPALTSRETGPEDGGAFHPMARRAAVGEQAGARPG